MCIAFLICFIVLFNVALDHISVSAASQQVIAGVTLLSREQGGHALTISPPPSGGGGAKVWHLSNTGNVQVSPLAMVGFQDMAKS